MKVFIGTSGWFYEWNEERTLDWYLNHSGLKSVELNASFYRFPFPNQVKAWAKKGASLRWAVKVNRLITHQYKFSERSFETWKRFVELFAPLSNMIDYFLFQLPPNFTPKVRNKIENFLEKTDSSAKFAFEPRNEAWFPTLETKISRSGSKAGSHVSPELPTGLNKEMFDWAKKLKITWVSIDAPEFSREIIKTTDTIYLRMHGRTGWYYHNYTNPELKDIAVRILKTRPKRIFIFFNNNHNMLKNAQAMQKIFTAASSLLDIKSIPDKI